MTNGQFVASAPGSTIGDRYVLDRLLGTGGMASVWAARDTRLDRIVAVKIIADTLALDPAFVARFEREARVLAALSHPHVVQIYDFGTDGNRPYLVMDYVGGGNLDERLRAGVAGWDPAVLAHELLSALAYIHAAGVLHRDLKPANVLVGTDGRIRLTDFGIAHPIDATRLTVTGLAMGTARFAPPEVVHGHPPTPRSDLYSCGVLLRECAPNSTALAPLIEALTRPDPADRPASAAEALAMLSGPRGLDTVPMRAPAAPAAVRSAARRLSFPRRLAVAAGATAAAGVVFLSLAGTRAEPAVAPPAEQGTVAERLDQLDAAIDQAR
ncbi:MAG: serine/threonine-protein kinase [Sporichthyaceae bacterium]